MAPDEDVSPVLVESGLNNQDIPDSPTIVYAKVFFRLHKGSVTFKTIQ